MVSDRSQTNPYLISCRAPHRMHKGNSPMSVIVGHEGRRFSTHRRLVLSKPSNRSVHVATGLQVSLSLARRNKS